MNIKWPMQYTEAYACKNTFSKVFSLLNKVVEIDKNIAHFHYKILFNAEMMNGRNLLIIRKFHCTVYKYWEIIAQIDYGDFII